MDGINGFGTAPEKEPPWPVQSEGTVANFRTGEVTVPEGLFPDEHVAETGDWLVVRASVKCPNCRCCLFLHPRCVVPRNTVSCFRCSWSSLSVVWWEDVRLSAFDEGGGDG